ncbi:MAG TPA: hypothetical protein VM846_16250 [Vicinamibacterales bacterium]|nr:hypothetical protein [Vicinamibacterales bacterium]
MRTPLLVALALALGSCSSKPAVESKPSADVIAAPRIWNDRDLAEWANPVAGLGVRPDHLSEADFYASRPAEWLRTYPVYFPGREPAGYWERLQGLKPEPLITPEARTKEGWTAAGKRVFEEMDVPIFRSRDAALIATVRSKEAFEKMGGHAQPDGRVHYLRWVPTSQGLALGVNDCASCHTRQLPDGTQLHGAQAADGGDGVLGALVAAGDERFFGEPPAIVAWRSFAVPWVANDIHEQLKSMTPEALASLTTTPPGTFARFNGSPFFPTQIPDLAGIKDRKYIDHTATHVLRGPEDIARYALLVTCCDPAGFGPHQMLTPGQRQVRDRMTDELTFALGNYLFSLEPAKNPQPPDPRADAGKEIFTRAGCVGCHTPPLYTNNKLSPVKGFTVPADHPNRADILSISVGTDPGLALKTRKGTGLYKVPSLRGVWYRRMLSHDGSVTSLEEWFDPARLRDDYVPSGFKGYKTTHRAVPGHEFGLRLTAEDKAALIAFLRTL